MSDRTYLDWPFLDDTHRAFARAVRLPHHEAGDVELPVALVETSAHDAGGEGGHRQFAHRALPQAADFLLRHDERATGAAGFGPPHHAVELRSAAAAPQVTARPAENVCRKYPVPAAVQRRTCACVARQPCMGQMTC